MSRRVWLGVVVFCAVGAAYLVGRHWNAGPTSVTVLAVSRQLPAYHVLTPTDLTPVNVKRRADGLAVVTAQLLGHYTERPLNRGGVIHLIDIGPSVPHDVSVDNVVSIEGDASLSLGGRLSAGDRVDMFAGGRATPLRREFVLAVQRINADRWVVTVALPSAVASSDAMLLSDGRVAIVRVT